MGHFFIYDDSSQFVGVNHGGEVIIARRDLFDPAIDLIRNSITKGDADQTGANLLNDIFNNMSYPSGYISALEAIKDHKKAYQREKASYEQFKNEFLRQYAHFHTSDMEDRKINLKSILSLIKIFLTNTSSMTCEALNAETTIRIAKKPSKVLSFFSENKTGDTIYAFSTKSVTDIECAPGKIKFFKGNSNFFTLTKDRCYF
jgi:hypothetical protein